MFILPYLVGALLILPASVSGAGLRMALLNGVDFGSGDEWIVDSIAIDNRNIYDLNDQKYNGFLFRAANHLHIVTRRQIIEQELLLSKGDVFSRELAEETARNLRTRFPFNDAWVEAEQLSPGRLLLRVVTIDQWSLIGGLRSIDRSGSETDLRIGFEERNLIGRAQFVSFDYYYLEKEQDYVTSSYREPRVFGRKLAFGIAYRSDPSDNLKRIQIGRPYYSLAQIWSFDVTVSKEDHREERFSSDGELVSQWMTSGEQVEISTAVRQGPSHRKTSLFTNYRYLCKHVEDTGTYISEPTALVSFPTDSIYHQFMLGAAHVLQSFIVEKRIRGFDYSEDITLGLGIEAGYGRAFKPGLRGYYFDLLQGEMFWVEKLGNSIVNARFARSFWLKQSTQLRRYLDFRVTVYNNRLSFLTWALRSFYVSDKGRFSGNIVLGGKNGLRGYPREATAGNRAHVTNVEGRFFLGLELLSVKCGSAIFMDLGRTWQEREPLTAKGYLVSFGAGLRFSLENLLRGEIIRIDGIVTKDGDWELSFGTGQYF